MAWELLRKRPWKFSWLLMAAWVGMSTLPLTKESNTKLNIATMKLAQRTVLLSQWARKAEQYPTLGVGN